MLSNLFSKPTPQPDFPAKPVADIPRYPPFLKGLPAALPSELQSTQVELITKLRQVLGFDQEEFDALIQPCLDHLSAYVHLLPASEHHHHSGAGGLFRHSLEVAFWAAQAAEGVIFVASGAPLEKKNLELRWRVAAALGGLFHDIGKPVSDLSITDKDGQHQWNPFLETLSQWARKHGIDRYFIRWRDGRCKRHEHFSILVLNQVMTPALLAWLTLPSPDILQAMLKAIGNTDPSHVLSKIITKADQTSVQRDLQSQRISIDDNALGVPVERYLLDAMRRLLSNAQWLVNQRDARVWIRKSHQSATLYLVWKSAVKDIIELLVKDKIPGIPRDPDTLADILIERGLASKHNDAERYQMLAPEILINNNKPIWLPMLRINDAEMLFSSTVPSGVALFTQTQWESEQTAESPTQDANKTKKTSKQQTKPKLTSPAQDDKKSNHFAHPNKLDKQEQTDMDAARERVGFFEKDTKNDDTFDKTSSSTLPEPLAWLALASNVLVKLDEHILIRYPDAVRPWCSPKKLLSELGRLDWLELDPSNPTRKVRKLKTCDGINEQGLLLNLSVSKKLMVWVDGTKSPKPLKPLESIGVIDKDTDIDNALIPPPSNPKSNSQKAVKASKKQRPIDISSPSKSDTKTTRRAKMENFINALPSLLTNASYPDVKTNDDGIRVTIHTLRAIATAHGISAGMLLQGLATSDLCQFEDDITVLFNPGQQSIPKNN